MTGRILILLITLVLTVFITGCSGMDTDGKKTTVGKLILEQDSITTITVVSGSSKQTSINIDDSDYIKKLLDEVQDIPVKRMSKDEDISFMKPRIQDEAMVSVYFYEYDTSKSLKGAIFIWPDGYVYAVDSESMMGNQRTVSYLSESKYPEIYDCIGVEGE